MSDVEILVADIMDGKYDGEADTIRRALRKRVDHVAEGVALTLKPGDIVKIKGIRPQYLNGLKAEIFRINRTRAVIKVVEEDRFRAKNHTQRMTIPFACIEPITAEAS